jgi:MrfA Zn-binding domain
VIGNVRRSQLITTYGVGAIVAVDDEAVMVAGLDDWRVDGEDLLQEPRLHIDGKRLLLPPGKDGSLFFEETGHIPVVRFPRWYYCSDPDCRRLDSFGRLSSGLEPKCKHCAAALIPSRFIAVCEEGHIEDFPYSAWVHRGSRPDPENRHDLSLRATGGAGSLAGIVVECACGEQRSMEGAFGRDALRGIRSCGGYRPWLRSNSEGGCGKLLRSSQRGASNVWFSNVRSVLSIPPWSDGLQKYVQSHWGTFGLDIEPEMLKALAGKVIESTGADYSIEELLAAVEARKVEARQARGEAETRTEEYRALCQGRSGDAEADFVAEVAEPPAGLGQFVDRVTVASRLREVRVFTGFSRLQPNRPSGDGSAIAEHADWLPAIAVHGEGVFLRLNEEAVSGWEANAIVLERVEELQGRWSRSFLYDGGTLISRFVLAHTLAHALIDQWSLAGGYPAASLRERIYADAQGVGILIYTAAADSAGSLGGLIAQAEPTRLGPSLEEAVKRYAWCSSDPVCSETRSQGAEGLNMAACHACALVPETSCEHRNGLLDRALLVGIPGHRDFGFFSSLIED